jgi:hypothetical protein
MGIPAAFGVGASGLPNAGDQANAVISGVITAVGPKKPFAFRGPMNLAIWASLVDALTTTAGSTSASLNSGTNVAAGQSINSANVPPGTTWATFSGTSGTLALPTVTYPALFNEAAQATYLVLPPGSNVAALIGATAKTESNNEGVSIPVSTTVAAIVQKDIAATNTSPGQPGIIQLSNAPTVTQTVAGPVPVQFDLSATGAITVTGADANAKLTGAGIEYSATVQLERSFDGGLTWIVCNIGGAGQLAQWTAGTPVSLTFGEPEKNVLYRLNCTAYSSGTINYRISQTGGAAESLAIGPLSGG